MSISSANPGENSGECGGSRYFEVYNFAGKDKGDVPEIEVKNTLETEEFHDAPARDSDYTDDGHDCQEKKNEEDSRFYEKLSKYRCCDLCLIRFPRTCAVFVGVIMPLLMLVSFSIIFGAILCDNESGSEISSNDFRLAQLYTGNSSARGIADLAMVLPRVCMVAYLLEEAFLVKNGTIEYPENSNVVELIEPFITHPRNLSSLLVPEKGDEFPNERPDVFDSAPKEFNATKFYYHMSSCGISGERTINDVLRRTYDSIAEESSPLTFNWIRCYVGAQKRQRSGGGGLMAEQRSWNGQAKVFSQAWDTDRSNLYNLYYQQDIESGMLPHDAHTNATADSINDATGGNTCGLNSPAGGWFWFTVQTTIGYGNTPVTTMASRAMVYTIGFFSILAFGGVLAVAGYITAYLFDDYAERWGMKILGNPWIGCVIWGTAYYMWMMLIATITRWWKMERLGMEFSIQDGYWFAFISTTSVGFGDIVLEPEGITTMDNLTFPVLFLVGFVYLSAFIGKFAEAILSLVQRGRKSFVDTLLDRHVKWEETFAQKDDIGQGNIPEVSPSL